MRRKRARLRPVKVTAEELAEAMTIANPSRAERRAHRDLVNRIVDLLFEQYELERGTYLLGKKYRVLAPFRIEVESDGARPELGRKALRVVKAKHHERVSFLHDLKAITAELKRRPTAEQKQQEREATLAQSREQAKETVSSLYGGVQ